MKILERNNKKFSWTKGDLHTNFGMIKEDDLKKAKTRVASHTNKEFKVYPANFNDQIKSFKRGPQAMMPKDIAIVLQYACIDKESIVLEAGTGSGILTAHLAKRAKQVISYEKNQSNLELAKNNLEKIGLENIEFKNKDIYEGIDEKELDLIFLDLPEPQNTVEHAFKSLKQGSYFITYLPNMTQVIEFVKKVEKYFKVEKVEELIEREWDVRDKIAKPKSRETFHTAFLIISRKI
jgi:tRNA (adenine57-N1/adenine58-N1)-methyltransferase catalytic subunit